MILVVDVCYHETSATIAGVIVTDFLCNIPENIAQLYSLQLKKVKLAIFYLFLILRHLSKAKALDSNQLFLKLKLRTLTKPRLKNTFLSGWM